MAIGDTEYCRVVATSGVALEPDPEEVGGVCPYLEPTNEAPEEEWRPYTATLTATPYRVAIGDSVELTGSGYTPGARVELVWHSVEGSYEIAGGTELVGQRYKPVTAVVAVTTADDAGDLRGTVTIPVDFGGPHDIRGRVDGHEVSQTGVSVTPTWSISPAEGPVGTMIELTVRGIDLRTSLNTWHVIWDNKYLGLITGVTTRGVGTARFRAAGPAGMHYLAAWNNSYRSTPYLAFNRSPFREELESPAEFTFNVTADEGAAPVQVDDFSAKDAPWPVEAIGAGRLSLSIDRGFVGDTVRLSGAQLPANADLDVSWLTAAGDRVTAGGINLHRRHLGEVRTGASGKCTFDFEIRSDLGGNHRIEVHRDGELLAATGFVIMPRVISYTPKVRAGDKIDVHLKGTGWTTYDNTYSVTYDNSFIGYACAFSTQGDMQFSVTATGAPGTHLLDLYPNMYAGVDVMPNVYAKPQLTYADDHPQRKTPSIRFSIEVTE